MTKKHKFNGPVASSGVSEPNVQERQMLLSLYSTGQYADAEALARNLIARHPQNSFSWKVLGAVLKQVGRIEDALLPMQKAVLLAPGDHEAYNNLGVTLKDLGRVDHAIACYRQALTIKPDYADGVGNLASILRDQGKLEEALKYYQMKIRLTPDDGECRHHIAALTGRNTERAPDQYVTAVFDAYAPRFDAHLQQSLQYAVPEKLAALVEATYPAPAAKWAVLDLGCGTGLSGAAFAPLARELVGVDLSARMLEKAAARQIYQRLVQSDLLAMMQKEAAASFDLIVSTDVFIYVGKIDEVVQEARRLLAPGGILAFSIESGEGAGGTVPPDEPGYHLQKSGRYSQSLAYIDRLAQRNGFKQLALVPEVIRQDNHVPIPGSLVVWQC